MCYICRITLSFRGSTHREYIKGTVLILSSHLCLPLPSSQAAYFRNILHITGLLEELFVYVRYGNIK